MSANTAGDGGAGSSTDKETNIKVVVRCRGRNAREIRDGSLVVAQAHGPNTLVVRPNPADRSASRSYAFDAVYGSEASQQRIFDDVVKPMLEEVQKGYNCSVFCYGQSGTGKTYTMEGRLENAESSPGANEGIIPRALRHIFSVLESNVVDYSVIISYLELYNEQLKDLLAPPEDEPQKLRIFEDGSRKASYVQGLGEREIRDVMAGIRALKAGSLKRRTAATKRKDKSSRSHTIFTITVYMGEATPGNDDLLSVGKLNLVYLAGPKDVGCSGAENKRARKTGNIDQSLLVLGRVIDALVEKSPHVPYGESKLTRLLQDSLGGRTKASVIATISPAKCSMEETLSTLDYARLARRIQNKPEVNQRMEKSALICEYVAKIDRLEAELNSEREKNGVYMSLEAYQSIIDETRSLKDEIRDLLQQGPVVADQAREKKDHSRRQLRTQGLLGREQASTESRLDAAARGLEMALDESMPDVNGRRAEIGRQKILDRSNLAAREASQNDLVAAATELEGIIEKFAGEHGDITSGLARAARSQLSHMAEVVEAISRQHVEKSLEEFSRRVEEAKEIVRKRRRLSGERDNEIKAVCERFSKHLQEQQREFQRAHSLAVRRLEESFIAQGVMLGNSLSKISAKQEKTRQEVENQLSEQRKAIELVAERVRLDAAEKLGRVREITRRLEDFAELERKRSEDERQEMKKTAEAILAEVAKFSESQARRIDRCVAAAAGRRSPARERKTDAPARQSAGLPKGTARPFGRG